MASTQARSLIAQLNLPKIHETESGFMETESGFVKVTTREEPGFDVCGDVTGVYLQFFDKTSQSRIPRGIVKSVLHTHPRTEKCVHTVAPGPGDYRMVQELGVPMYIEHTDPKTGQQFLGVIEYRQKRWSFRLLEGNADDQLAGEIQHRMNEFQALEP